MRSFPSCASGHPLPPPPPHPPPPIHTLAHSIFHALLFADTGISAKQKHKRSELKGREDLGDYFLGSLYYGIEGCCALSFVISQRLDSLLSAGGIGWRGGFCFFGGWGGGGGGGCVHVANIYTLPVIVVFLMPQD